MYPPLQGRDLSDEQVEELDNTFFCSDPWSHFRSAIEMLLKRHDDDASHDAEVSNVAEAAIRHRDAEIDEQQAADTFGRHLGRPVDPFEDIERADRRRQVVSDAYALRHHVAECLVRLTAVVLEDRQDAEHEIGTWSRLSEGPRQVSQILDQLGTALTTPEARARFTEVAIPRDAYPTLCCDARLASAIDVFGAWLQHAADLLHGHQLQLSAAHNKLKHGFAVRTRDDLKVVFATRGADADGTIPLSALTGSGAVDVFDRPVLEFLARAPKRERHSQGLELTQLRVDVAGVLAETHMLAWTHAAIFHTAARAHFDHREGRPAYLRPPRFPGLPVGGPSPEDIDQHAVVGMRHPLTTPPGGGPARPAGIGFRSRFVPFTVMEPSTRDVVIVDDQTRPVPPTRDA